MTHEQKPESAEFLRNSRAMQAKVKRRLADRTKRAEFRTRDAERAATRTRQEQKEALIRHLQAGGATEMGGCGAKWIADRHIAEAEARGAAEQRRKDAEGAEFRPREVQVSECSGDLRASLTALDEKLYSEFVEAELRGAAWQRQSDAEDNEIARWQAFKCGRGWFDISNDERSQYGDHIRPLYTRPANVAALEARVKELEGCEKDAARFRWLVENVGLYYGIPGFAAERGRSTEKRVDDQLRAIDANIERAAAAIREGGEHG